MNTIVNSFLSGAIFMALWAIGFFFLRFWQRTKEGLFLAFAIAFWVLAAERVVPLIVVVAKESDFWIYGFRLVAFGIIIAAIIQKNRR